MIYVACGTLLVSGTVFCAAIVVLILRDAWRRSRAKPSTPAPIHGRAATAPAPKLRVRISRDGWIRNAGGSFPFHPGTLVELAFDDGRTLLKPYGVEAASYWHESWWNRDAASQSRNIAFYRIVRLSPPVTTAPRIAR